MMTFQPDEGAKENNDVTKDGESKSSITRNAKLRSNKLKSKSCQALGCVRTHGKKDGLANLRQRKSMEMERDLAVQASTMLRDLVGDSLTDQQHAAVESWLAAQLETERSGWKQKLTMAMREIEKERKQALDVHTAIYKINERIEAHGLLAARVQREQSMYMNADKDMKVGHLVALEKHVNTMLALIENAERQATLAVYPDGDRRHVFDLDRLPDGRNIDDIIEEAEQMKRLMEESRAETKELEERLTKEIALLSDTVQLQESVIRDLTANNAKEVDELKAEVTKLRAQQEATKARERTGSNERHDKGIGVCMRIPMRECCIQTDRDLEDMNQKTEASRRSADPSGEICLPDHRLKPLIEVTISNSGHHMTNNNLAADRVRHSSTQDAGGYPRKGTADADNAKALDRVSNLRHQVVTFAQKLEDARWKMDEYQRQMSLIRTNPRCRRPPGDANDAAPTGALNRKWKSSDGYLCGIRKDIVDSPRSTWNSGDTLNRDSKRTKRDRNLCGMTNTCFRCHKVYRLKENHRMACRYHPKGKQNIERYDNTGKLVRIVQVWECCMQQNDAIGCSVGEHI